MSEEFVGHLKLMLFQLLKKFLFLPQWRSRVKIIGGARTPQATAYHIYIFWSLPNYWGGPDSPRYGIYIYIFWSLPNYWGGPGPQGPLMLLRPCTYQHKPLRTVPFVLSLNIWLELNYSHCRMKAFT